MGFPSEINLGSLDYFNCASVEAIAFWSKSQKKKKKEEYKEEIAFSFLVYFPILQSV